MYDEVVNTITSKTETTMIMFKKKHNFTDHSIKKQSHNMHILMLCLLSLVLTSCFKPATESSTGSGLNTAGIMDASQDSSNTPRKNHIYEKYAPLTNEQSCKSCNSVKTLFHTIEHKMSQWTSCRNQCAFNTARYIYEEFMLYSYNSTTKKIVVNDINFEQENVRANTLEQNTTVDKKRKYNINAITFDDMFKWSKRIKDFDTEKNKKNSTRHLYYKSKYASGETYRQPIWNRCIVESALKTYEVYHEEKYAFGNIGKGISLHQKSISTEECGRSTTKLLPVYGHSDFMGGAYGQDSWWSYKIKIETMEPWAISQIFQGWTGAFTQGGPHYSATIFHNKDTESIELSADKYFCNITHYQNAKELCKKNYGVTSTNKPYTLKQKNWYIIKFRIKPHNIDGKFEVYIANAGQNNWYTKKFTKIFSYHGFTSPEPGTKIITTPNMNPNTEITRSASDHSTAPHGGIYAGRYQLPTNDPRKNSNTFNERGYIRYFPEIQLTYDEIVVGPTAESVDYIGSMTPETITNINISYPKIHNNSIPLNTQPNYNCALQNHLYNSEQNRIKDFPYLHKRIPSHEALYPSAISYITSLGILHPEQWECGDFDPYLLSEPMYEKFWRNSDTKLSSHNSKNTENSKLPLNLCKTINKQATASTSVFNSLKKTFLNAFPSNFLDIFIDSKENIPVIDSEKNTCKAARSSQKSEKHSIAENPIVNLSTHYSPPKIPGSIVESKSQNIVTAIATRSLIKIPSIQPKNSPEAQHIAIYKDQELPKPINIKNTSNKMLDKRTSIIQIDDKDLQFNKNHDDQMFHNMNNWANTGVKNGIPPFKINNVFATINQGTNLTIQRAIDGAAQHGGGIILLKEGLHILNEPIHMRSNTILRGENRSKTVLINNIKTLNIMDSKDALSLKNIEYSGVEKLTILNKYKYPVASNMNNSKPTFSVVSLNLSYCNHCWLDTIDVLNSGTSPLHINQSNHITIRNSTFDGAWNKKDNDGGINISSSHSLFYNNKIKNLNKILLSNSEYNVFYQNQIEHTVHIDKNTTTNLFESNTIIPTTDKKPCFQPIQTQTNNANLNNQQFDASHNNYIYKNHCIEGRKPTLQSRAKGKNRQNSKNRHNLNTLYTITNTSSINEEAITPKHETLYNLTYSSQKIMPTSSILDTLHHSTFIRKCQTLQNMTSAVCNEIFTKCDSHIFWNQCRNNILKASLKCKNKPNPNACQSKITSHCILIKKSKIRNKCILKSYEI